MNGDGQANDRLYVPTAAEIASYRVVVPTGSTAAAEQQRLSDAIEADQCLRERRGQVVGRNSCRNPWQNVLDVRAAKTFDTLRGQNVELVADFFNVLNGLSKKHGTRLEVSAADQALLNVTGFDRTARQYVYQVNPSFGTATPTQFTLNQQFQVQLGLRYGF